MLPVESHIGLKTKVFEITGRESMSQLCLIVQEKLLGRKLIGLFFTVSPVNMRKLNNEFNYFL